MLQVTWPARFTGVIVAAACPQRVPQDPRSMVFCRNVSRQAAEAKRKATERSSLRKFRSFGKFRKFRKFREVSEVSGTGHAIPNSGDAESLLVSRDHVIWAYHARTTDVPLCTRQAMDFDHPNSMAVERPCLSSRMPSGRVAPGANRVQPANSKGGNWWQSPFCGSHTGGRVNAQAAVLAGGQPIGQSRDRETPYSLKQPTGSRCCLVKVEMPGFGPVARVLGECSRFAGRPGNGCR